ncbi:T7SS effector LXG polymorphic toxin [Ligilactobacillus sp. LYQ135]
MVKMKQGDSDTQANSCLTTCQNLSVALDGVIQTLNQIGSADVKGNAADSAKSFATSVAIPLVDQTKNLLNVIQSDVQDFPNKYRSKVDSKDWSTSKLQKLINNCETQIIKQQLSMSLASAAFATNPTPSKDSTKVLDSMQDNIDALKKKKKKYQKILKKLNKFNESSPSIFSDVKDLNKAVSQGCVDVSGNYTSGSYQTPKDLDWKDVGKGGDKDVYKVKKVKKTSEKSTQDIIIGLIPNSESKTKKKIKTKLPKSWNKDWDYKKFERTFFKKATNDLNEINKIDKFSNIRDGFDEVVGGVFKPVKDTIKIFDVAEVGQNFNKRIKKGEPVVEALGRTVVAFAGTKVADLAGGVAGRIGGGVIGMTIGGVIGSVVPGAGTMLGAEIGAEIGSTIGGVCGSVKVSNVASKELNKDIE